MDQCEGRDGRGPASSRGRRQPTRALRRARRPDPSVGSPPRWRRGSPPASTGGEPAPAGTRLANSALFASWATTAIFDAVDRLAAIGEQCGGTLLDLAVGWLAAQPTVPSVLVGVTKSEQVTASPRRRQPSSRPVVADPVPATASPRRATEHVPPSASRLTRAPLSTAHVAVGGTRAPSSRTVQAVAQCPDRAWERRCQGA